MPREVKMAVEKKMKMTMKMKLVNILFATFYSIINSTVSLISLFSVSQ